MTIDQPGTSGLPVPRPPFRRQVNLVRRILRDPQPVLDELRAEFGPVVGLGIGPARMAVIGGATAVRELLARPTNDFRWNHKFNALGFVVGDGSMIVSDGGVHRHRRSSVQTAFSRRRLNRWMPMIVDRTDTAVADLLAAHSPSGRAIDLDPFIRLLLIGIVVRALFGERLSARSDEIGALFQRPQRYLESPALRQLPHPLPFTARSRVRSDRRALDALIDAEIARHRADPVDDPLDVLGTLVHAGSLTDAEMRDQVVTLIGAGYDTTSASLGWMLARVAREPALWDRLRAEADEVFGTAVAPEVHDDTLGRLQLANGVMREALRLHPAGALTPREAAVDVVIDGRRITKGTLVLWSAHLAGRDPAVWDDPLRFDPDRFIDPSPAQQAASDLAWVPFGGGARNCIGFALAQMELTLIVARLAQHLDIEPVSAAIPTPIGMVVNRPKGGVILRVTRRSR